MQSVESVLSMSGVVQLANNSMDWHAPCSRLVLRAASLSNVPPDR